MRLGVKLDLNLNPSPTTTGEVGLIPRLGKSPGGRNGNTLQYSCLENPMDRGAWVGYSPLGWKESDMAEVT